MDNRHPHDLLVVSSPGAVPKWLPGAAVSQLSAWPLFDYCAMAWPKYLQDIGTVGGCDDGILRSLRRFVDSYKLPGGGNYGVWLQKYAANYVPKTGQTWTMLPPLHLAAGRGWLAVVQIILDNDKKDLETQAGESLCTLLLPACVYKQEPVVRYLLQRGAEPSPGNARALLNRFLPNMSESIRKLMTDAL